MALDGQNAAMQTENYIVMPDLLATTQQALESLDTLLKEAKGTVKSLVAKDGRISSSLMEQHQAAAHGLSWLATYHESMRQMQNWATKLTEAGEFGEAEQLLHQIACGEYHDAAYSVGLKRDAVTSVIVFNTLFIIFDSISKQSILVMIN